MEEAICLMMTFKEEEKLYGLDPLQTKVPFERMASEYSRQKDQSKTICNKMFYLKFKMLKGQTL
jgi:hypothetical protein